MSKEYEIHKQNINKKSKLLKREIDIYHKATKIMAKNKSKNICKNCNNKSMYKKLCVHNGLCYTYWQKVKEMKENITDTLRFILPHGSGIDAEWYFEFCKNGTIICRNSYHAMNDNGYYMKWIPISVRIFRHKKNVYHKYGIDKIKYQIISEKGRLNWELRAPNSDHYAYMLNDSLYESFDNVLSFLDECNLQSIEKKDFKKPYTLE